MTGTAHERRLLAYGVGWAPVRIDGLPAIWAVDAFGDVRKIRKIKPGDDAEALAERLWAWLLEHHPPHGQLALVRDVAPAPVELVRDPYSRRQVDVRLLTDPRSPCAARRYRDALVRNAVRRSGILRFRDEPRGDT